MTSLKIQRRLCMILAIVCLLNLAAGADNWREHLDELAETYLATTEPDEQDAFSSIARTLVEGRSFFFDLFDSSKTSDACQFKCSKGSPVMNPKNKAKMDGCGSYNFHLDFDKLDMPGFTDCCNNHDICYETCNYNRQVCDDEFLDCLRDKCKENKVKNEKAKRDDKGVKLPLPDICMETADFMYKLVQKLGCPAYLSAQKKACLCKIK